MTLLFYAVVAIVTVDLFAAVVYYYLHRGAGLAISLVGTVLICIGLTYAMLNDVPASQPSPTAPTTTATTEPAPIAHTPAASPTIHPSLVPSPTVSRETTPAPVKAPAKPKPVQKKTPVARKHFDDMEKQLSHTDKGTDPGAGGCDDIAAGGCK